jgi:hypothetical protein
MSLGRQPQSGIAPTPPRPVSNTILRAPSFRRPSADGWETTARPPILGAPSKLCLGGVAVQTQRKIPCPILSTSFCRQGGRAQPRSRCPILSFAAANKRVGRELRRLPHPRRSEGGTAQTPPRLRPQKSPLPPPVTLEFTVCPTVAPSLRVLCARVGRELRRLPHPRRGEGGRPSRPVQRP